MPLAEQRPADPDDRGPLLYRDLEVIAHPHGQVRPEFRVARAQPAGELPEPGERRSGVLWPIDQPADSHQPADVELLEREDLPQLLLDGGRREARLRGVVVDVDLEKDRDARRGADLRREPVDPPRELHRIDRLATDVRPGERVPVLLQVNVDDDTAKAGFSSAAIEEQLGEILALEHIDVRGLMTIGRLVDRPEDARPTFAGLREFAGRLRARHPNLGPDLSMGMSDDFEIAVEEGATIVRVGRALFGERH